MFFSFSKLQESPQKKIKTEYTIENERYLVNLIFNLPLELFKKRMVYVLDVNYNEKEIKKFLKNNGHTMKLSQGSEPKLKMCERVAFGMINGKLPICPNCKTGRLQNVDDHVKCLGYWSPLVGVVTCSYTGNLDKTITPRWISINNEVALTLRTAKLLNDFEIYKIQEELEVKKIKMIKKGNDEEELNDPKKNKNKKEKLSTKQKFEKIQEKKLKKEVKRIFTEETKKEELQKQHQEQLLQKECTVKKTKKKIDRTKSFLNGILEKEVMDALSDLQIKDLEKGYYSVQKYLNSYFSNNSGPV